MLFLKHYRLRNPSDEATRQWMYDTKSLNHFKYMCLLLFALFFYFFYFWLFSIYKLVVQSICFTFLRLNLPPSPRSNIYNYKISFCHLINKNNFSWMRFLPQKPTHTQHQMTRILEAIDIFEYSLGIWWLHMV